MNECKFELSLFHSNHRLANQQSVLNTTLDTTVQGHLKLDSQHIVIDFQLANDTSLIKHTAKSPKPQRKDGLWRTTCFELFTAASTGLEYWEYNLSPSHDWNAYSFNDYRQGQTLASFVSGIKISTSYYQQQLSGLKASLPLPPPLAGQELNIGISCVLQDINDNLNYYALIHPKQTPDFHDRRSFVICLQH